VAGVVRSAPPGSGLRPGDRVWAAVWEGGHAELLAAAPGVVFPLSSELSFEQGAALGSNHLTAVFALRRRARLAAGETVVVLGAAGGLGTAIVAVARALGAKTIAVVSSPDKEDVARTAGADEVVVGEDWLEPVRGLTGGRGAEVVADIVGGEANLQALRATAFEGRVLILGFAAGSIPQIAANRLLLRNIDVVGVGFGASEAAQPDIVAATARELQALIDRGLRPVVGEAFPLERGAEAIRRLESRTARAKIVLTIGG
jgi:NADPH2:quinone reductase